MRLEKKHVEIIVSLIFLISYLLFFNLLFLIEGLGPSIYAPGTLIFALLGYWLGGYLYDRYFK